MDHPESLRFRQIHLDFHTSEAIPDVAAAFDPQAWADQLATAHVDSVTCFARCHHGWIYYHTTRHPERRHPTLARNLLADQIAAAHARGIRVPIYTTVQWDHYTARHHPEWLQRSPEGCMVGQRPLEPGFYARLCLNTPYVDFLRDHVADLFATLPVDGLFFDIVQPQECVCPTCMERMQAAGLDPADPDQRRHFGRETVHRFQREMTAYVRGFSPDCTIFYNAGHIGPGQRDMADTYTHFELESLPGGGWGYIHFPLAQRYARTLGKDTLGMTGRFHTSWGDFHSYKHPAALQFEVFRMLALNARCSIGDQLHPTGRLDHAAYRLIGSVYREVAAKEPWCRGARPVVDMAILTPETFTGERISPEAAGALRMLEEAGHQFDVVDERSELAGYRVLLLPDRIPVDPGLAARLEDFLAQGGRILASFQSGLDPAGQDFALAAWGVHKAGEGPLDREGRPVRGRIYPRGDWVDYVLPGEALSRGLAQTEHVMYTRGLDITPAEDAEVLALTVDPYFHRDMRHFCSHRQAPSSGRVRGPAVVRRGPVIYFAHPVFRLYHHSAPRWCKLLVLNALDLLLPHPVLRHQGPGTLLATVNEQPTHGRWVLHFLHYIPERRGQAFDIVEDVIPLQDVAVSISPPAPVTAVRTVPQGVALDFLAHRGRVNFVVPRIEGHQMVEVAF